MGEEAEGENHKPRRDGQAPSRSPNCKERFSFREGRRRRLAKSEKLRVNVKREFTNPVSPDR